MTEDDFDEIMAFFDEISSELYFEAQNAGPAKRLQKYFGNWLLTRIRLHLFAAYSGYLNYEERPQHSHFHVNQSGFRLIHAEGYLLYAVEVATGLMYVYDTEDWLEWIRRIDTRLEELFLYTDRRSPHPVLAGRGRHLTLQDFVRERPRPLWLDVGSQDFFAGLHNPCIPQRTWVTEKVREAVKLAPGEYICKSCFYLWVAPSKRGEQTANAHPLRCPRCKHSGWYSQEPSNLASGIQSGN